MYYYLLYNSTIQSEINMPQLITSLDNDICDIKITIGNISKAIINKSKEKSFHFKGDIFWFTNKTGIFVISNGNEIKVKPHPNKDISECIVYILGYCMSLLFFQRDIPAIHCSCICDENGAIILSGNSGNGKSTLSSKFISNGYRLVADDIAMVNISNNSIYVYPAYPQQKLCRDAVIASGLNTDDLKYIDEDKDKYALHDSSNFTTRPIKLTNFILLNKYKGNTIMCKEIQGTDRLSIFLSNLFLYRFHQYMDFSPKFMKNCLSIANMLPMYATFRPESNITTTDELYTFIVQDLSIK